MMNASLFFSTPFLLSAILLMVIVVTAGIKYAVAGAKLKASAFLPLKDGKKLREEANKEATRVTLGLLIVLATFVCIYTMYPDWANNKINLYGLGLNTVQEICTVPDEGGKGYSLIVPCELKNH